MVYGVYISLVFYGYLTIIRLCTETPPAGGRVFEKGDELLVEFAHKIQGTYRPSLLFFPLQSIGDYESVPLVIVFTQYDRLVRTKKAELEEEEGITDPVRSEDDALKAFEKCLSLVEKTITRYLKVPMPRYAKASGIFVPLVPIWLLTTR
jgi:hypothetical protein